MDSMDDIKKLVDFFFKKQITVHIRTKDKDFYNGLIMEIHESFIVIRERVLGETAVPFSEMVSIKKYREKKNG